MRLNRMLAIMFAAFSASCRCEETPPSIEYPNVRKSTVGIDAGGINVAVDKGIEWQGVKVYLSLTFDLLGVDSQSGKTIWHHDAGAFWTGMAIKQMEIAGEKIWAVELHGTADDDPADKKFDYYELKTGMQIKLTPPKPSGVPLLAVRTITSDCAISRPFYALISTQEGFDKVWKRLNGRPDRVLQEDRGHPYPPSPAEGYAEEFRPPDVDFTKSVVLVCATGDSINTSDFSAEEAYEDDNRVLLRVKLNGFQTGPFGVFRRNCNCFVLPRQTNKIYVLQQDASRVINGPPLWREQMRVEKLTDGSHELDAMPKRIEPKTAGNVQRQIKHFNTVVQESEYLGGFDSKLMQHRYEYDYYLDGAGKQVLHGPFKKITPKNHGDKIELMGEYADGERNGLWTYYVRPYAKWNNETPQFTVSYDRGEFDGPLTVYDVNGKVVETGQFEQGVPHGQWTRFHDGVKVHEQGYQHGLFDGPMIFRNKDGQETSEMHFVKGQLAGPYTRWLDDGTVAEKGQFSAGEFSPPAINAMGERGGLRGYYDGEWVRYGKDGRELWRGTFDHGTGLLAGFDDDGRKTFEGRMVNGVYDGECRWWNKNGNIERIETIVPHGESLRVAYHDNGEKESETHWTGGAQTGTSRWWDRDGKLEAEGEWRFGQPWSGRCVYLTEGWVRSYSDGKQSETEKEHPTRKTQEAIAERERKAKIDLTPGTIILRPKL